MAVSGQLKPVSRFALNLLLSQLEGALGVGLLSWQLYSPEPGRTHNPLVTVFLVVAMVSSAALVFLAQRFADVPPRRRQFCAVSAVMAAVFAVIGVLIYEPHDDGASTTGVMVCCAALAAAFVADALRARPARSKARPTD